MIEDLQETLDEGGDLATRIVDHLRGMGNASAAFLPVYDRAEEYVVIVMSREDYERRRWPITPNTKIRGGEHQAPHSP